MFLTALFTVAKKWKQFKSQSTDEWMDGQKAVCPHNEIFFSNKKK
jgi:hypothetical protein